MAGIYIHIPFCKQACSYCNFHFSTSLKRKSELIKAILHEAQLQKNYLKGELVDTIYFGGGTPSLLEEKEIKAILHKLFELFEVTEEVELTLEANPDDLTTAKLKSLKSSGINRLSIGVQSFHQADLDLFNRSHNASQAINSIKNAQDVGFENLNLDLIFGAQTTSDVMWQENLDQFFTLKIPHLSAYSLTLEEKTALKSWVESEKVKELDEGKNYRHYQTLIKEIEKQGFQQYELSNFCKEENISKHNTSYWFGKKYLGLGPSAHSFDGKSRQWNAANNAKYMKALANNTSFFEIEELSEIDRYHEYLITRLRTKWGIHFADFKANFSAKVQNHFFKQIEKVDTSTILRTQERLRLLPDRLFQSDEVVRELMC